MNIYYNPEKHGLEVVAEWDSAGDYEFDITIVWRHKETGDLYTANDSGCSCPTPFEGYTSLADLTKITTQQVMEETMSRLVDEGEKLDTAWRKYLSSKEGA